MAFWIFELTLGKVREENRGRGEGWGGVGGGKDGLRAKTEVAEVVNLVCFS